MKKITIVFIVVVIIVAGYFVLVKKPLDTNPTINTDVPSDTASASYVLYQMTDSSVIRMATGKVGEKVYLLKNPEFREIGDSSSKVTIPLAPKNPIWDSVPDGTYTNISFGAHFFIQESKIVRVTDRNAGGQ